MIKRFYDWLLPIAPIRWLGGKRVVVPYLIVEPMQFMTEKEDISPIEPLFSFEKMTKEVFEYKRERGLLNAITQDDRGRT